MLSLRLQVRKLSVDDGQLLLQPNAFRIALDLLRDVSAVREQEAPLVALQDQSTLRTLGALEALVLGLELLEARQPGLPARDQSSRFWGKVRPQSA